MAAPSKESLRYGVLVGSVMESHGVTIEEAAARLGVSSQTIKNALENKSVNARFVVRLIREFGIEEDRTLLRRFLLGFLLLQFDDKDEELLTRAGFVRDQIR